MSTSTLDRLPANPRSRPSPSRRLVRIVGLALILIGLSLLGWVGWQLYGTNWVSHRHQAQVVADLRDHWGQGDDNVAAAQSHASAIVKIPRFGQDYEVPLLDGTSEEVLATGFGHFPDTADPGQNGNFALAAHRITHGEPLRRMPELEVGDAIIFETRSAIYTYVLDSGGDDLVLPLTSSWVVGPTPRNPEPGGVEPVHNSKSLITLTTCAELFHTDNRMVAFGHLESVKPTPEHHPGSNG